MECKREPQGNNKQSDTLPTELGALAELGDIVTETYLIKTDAP